MISTSSADQTRRSVPLSFGLIVFGAALILNLHVFLRGWEQNLMGFHQFREIQTALSSYYYLQDGLSLNYLTPLFGPPWQVTLEFPLYQAAAAIVAQITGLALEPAGRLTSWLFFLSALPAGYLLLGRFRVTPGMRLIFLALLLLSPIYVYFSRLFMIESTAMALGLWFLLGFSRVVEDRRFAWLPVVWLAGGLCGAVKITTWAVFLVAAAILFIHRWRQDPKLATRDGRWLFGLTAIALVLPFAAGLGWTWYAKHLRALNPEIDFLNSHFGFWSFGDFAQRTSWAFWSRTTGFWVDEMIGEAGFVIVAAGLGWLRGRPLRRVVGCLLTFISGQLVFSNLYWVHDYYFYAAALFLVAALGFCLAELLERPAVPAWAGRATVAAFALFQVVLFQRTFEPYLKTETPVPPLASVVAEITRPDEIVVILGLDWDSAVPYYSGRRALMLMRGREWNPAGIRKSIERLDATKIGAVVIVGEQRNNVDLVQGAMSMLQLGELPLVSSDWITLWVPRYRHATVRGLFKPEKHEGFRILPAVAEKPPEGLFLVGDDIKGRPEFATFSPLPLRAHTRNDFALCEVDDLPMMVAHSTSEFVLPVSEKDTRLTGSFGIHPPAYLNGNSTDGIELAISYRVKADVVERRLFSRILDPLKIDADRGTHKFDVPLNHLKGELVIRVLPGPQGSGAWDWSYIGQVAIK